jgi:hypothetical protein
MSHSKSAQAAEKQARVAESHRAPHRASLAASKLKPLDWSAELKIRRDDIAVFSEAARYFDHIISVRATNTQSLRYIGQKMFSPKPIDCKPKTADNNAYLRSGGQLVECAGLVVDPTVVGFSAFKSERKSEAARHSWGSFLKDKTDEELARKVFRRRESKGFYAVERYKQSKYFGCLMLSNQDVPAKDFDVALAEWQDFKNTQMNYIHGDYDLYGLIYVVGTELAVGSSEGREKYKPTVLQERLHGTPHFYTPAFPQIKAFLNAGIGAEMIQHASQDNVAHQGDELYVFYPNGGKYQLNASANAIKEIYEFVFRQEVVD